MVGIVDLTRQQIRARERHYAKHPEIDVFASIECRLRKDQLRMLSSFKKRNFVSAHRRWGKSHSLVAYILERAAWCHHKLGNYGYFFATRSQGFKAVWELVELWVDKIPGATIDKGHHCVYVPNVAGGRSRVMFEGLNHTSNRGPGWDGLVIDECGEILESKIKAELLPALRDPSRRGNDAKGRVNQWLIYCGTPLGQNWFYRQYLKAQAWAAGNPYKEIDRLTGEERLIRSSGWSFTYLPISKTDLFDDAEKAEMEAELGEEDYLRECELDWTAATVGSFFGKQMRMLQNAGQIGAFPHVPGEPVHCAWDLGFTGLTVIWFFQIIDHRVRFIDAFSYSEEDLGWYLDDFLPGRRERFGYEFGSQFFPHDSTNTDFTGGVDRTALILAKLDEHELGDFVQVPLHDPKVEGLDAVRWLLPRSSFNAGMCDVEVNNLRMHRRRWDPNHETLNEPVKDGSEHAVDAYRQAAFGLKYQLAA